MFKKRKKYLWIIIPILIFICGIFLYKNFNQQGAGRRYRTVKAEKGEIRSLVTATGTVNPEITVLVGSQISGTIKALYADFNSRVRAGQVIAQIDPSIFEAQVEQGKANLLNAQAVLSNAKANLLQAEANLKKAEVAVIDAKRNLDRNIELMEKGVIAQATLDTSKVNYDSALAQREIALAQLEAAKSQLESAKAQVEQAKANLRIHETNLKYTTIRSPVNGIVISRNVDVGQTVAASLQAPTLFTIAKDLSQMQVNASISEADIGKIAIDQEATFTVDAYPELTFRGKVSDIRNAPVTVQNVVTYDVIIKVENLDLKLKPGMTANVSILVDHREGVLKIPNSALRFSPKIIKGELNPDKRRFDLSDKKVFGGKAFLKESINSKLIWILSKEGKPVPVRVILGIADGNFTEVIGGDLREGMDIIVEEVSDKKASPQRSQSPPHFIGGIRK